MAAALSASGAAAASLDECAEHYRENLIRDIDRSLAGARTLRERLAASDIDGAKRAWIEARVGWERSEVFTSGFVPELDQEIDAWPNAAHGFHGIEAGLFRPTPADTHEEVDALVGHLTELRAQVRDIPLAPQRLLNGLARLAFEMGGDKADGGESRLSGTSLNDLQSNADGIELAWRVIFAEALEGREPKQAGAVRTTIDDLHADVRISDLRTLNTEALRKHSEDLIVLLQAAAPSIGLRKPTLEEVSQ